MGFGILDFDLWTFDFWGNRFEIWVCIITIMPKRHQCHLGSNFTYYLLCSVSYKGFFLSHVYYLTASSSVRYFHLLHLLYMETLYYARIYSLCVQISSWSVRLISYSQGELCIITRLSWGFANNTIADPWWIVNSFFFLLYPKLDQMNFLFLPSLVEPLLCKARLYINL